MLGQCLDEGGSTARAMGASCHGQGHESPGDVFWRAGWGVRGACRPFPDPGRIVCIIARPPRVEPTFRADQVLPDSLDLLVGKVGVERQGTPVCWTVRHGGCLCTGRVSCAARVLRSVCGVLAVLAHRRWRARPPGRAEGKPGEAACLETPAPASTGAGGGVESQGGRRDNALDAQERSQTQWLTWY